MDETIRVFKIGGNIIDHPERLQVFLADLARISGPKVLVHGGGKLATQLAERLDVPQQMIDGRRITDAETLRITTMVYAGLINKNIVASLYANQCPALGVCGADGDLIRAHKRTGTAIDFGYVGDVDAVNTALLRQWLEQGLTVVVAPISHDGNGRLLNTNADTIAQEIAKALSATFEVELIYIFEKSGVLSEMDDENAVIPHITTDLYLQLKKQGIINAGMIPKLDNAFFALQKGVKKVLIGKAEDLQDLLSGQAGTSIV